MNRNADGTFAAAGGAESAPSGSGTAGIDAPAGGLDYSETTSQQTASDDEDPAQEQVRIGVHDKLGRVGDKARELRTKLADRRDVKADIQRQVRDNPGRTLLIALAVGFVLGKAFRGDR